MTTLHLTRGLPASGKSTRARAWAAESPLTRARCNRDDLRTQLFGGWTGLPEHEEALTVVQRAAVRGLLVLGLDVVVDDTNLRAEHVEAFRDLAAEVRAAFDVWDLTDVPLETCLQRNEGRAGTASFVPPDVIRDMHARYLEGAR